MQLAHEFVRILPEKFCTFTLGDSKSFYHNALIFELVDSERQNLDSN